MKTVVCIFIFSTAFLLTFSQKASFQQNNFKISLLYPGISFESKISTSSTINICSFFSFAARLPSKGSQTGKFFDPAFSVQYKLYKTFHHNFSLENSKGEIIWYLCAGYKDIFSRKPLAEYRIESKRRSVNVLGIGAGIQRLGEKKFFFNADLGPAYRFAKVTTNNDPLNYKPYHKSYAEIIFAGQLSIGFYFRKRR